MDKFINVKKLFTTKNLTKIALFSALSFILTFLEFPIFPQADFLKLDFSNVFVLIGGFYLGYEAGIIILIVKELLCFLKGSTFVGIIANLLIGLAFILVPLIVYNFKKSFKVAVITLCIAVIIQVISSLIVNRFINFPLYFSTMARKFFNDYVLFIILFNFIKGIAISVLTLALYKKIKRVLDF